MMSFFKSRPVRTRLQTLVLARDVAVAEGDPDHAEYLDRQIEEAKINALYHQRRAREIRCGVEQIDEGW